MPLNVGDDTEKLGGAGMVGFFHYCPLALGAVSGGPSRSHQLTKQKPCNAEQVSQGDSVRVAQENPRVTLGAARERD